MNPIFIRYVHYMIILQHLNAVTVSGGVKKNTLVNKTKRRNERTPSSTRWDRQSRPGGGRSSSAWRWARPRKAAGTPGTCCSSPGCPRRGTLATVSPPASQSTGTSRRTWCWRRYQARLRRGAEGKTTLSWIKTQAHARSQSLQE